MRLTGKDSQEPDHGGPLPVPVSPWPKWRGDEPVTAPDGHPYLLATLRMSVTSGRTWQRHRLIENDQLRTRLTPLLGTLPLSHSYLQEPHGGHTCRFSEPSLTMWQDTDPDHWPNTLYRQLTAEDGPRQGLGEVTVTLRLEPRGGEACQVERVISECNVRADGRLLVAQLGHDRLPFTE